MLHNFCDADNGDDNEKISISDDGDEIDEVDERQNSMPAIDQTVKLIYNDVLYWFLVQYLTIFFLSRKLHLKSFSTILNEHNNQPTQSAKDFTQ